MTTPTVGMNSRQPWPTYIGFCCREWILAAGVRVGTCGLCGEKPTYLRPDEDGAA